MFGKVLKYDMKYVARIWWMLAIGIVGLTVAASLVLRFIIETANKGGIFPFLTLMGILFMFVSMIAIFGSLVVTQVLVFVRFYKNFFTDEGYLTFTLPVSRKKLLLAKTVNGLIWYTLHTILLVACVGIFIFIGIMPIKEMLNIENIKGLFGLFGALWDSAGAWIIVYVLEALIVFELLAAFGICLVELCITIGAVVAKKQKVIAAVGIYYLVNMVLSTVISVITMIFLVGLSEGFFILFAELTQGLQFAVAALVILIFALIIAAAVSILYFMTLSRIERKLNLA